MLNFVLKFKFWDFIVFKELSFYEVLLIYVEDLVLSPFFVEQKFSWVFFVLY